MKIWCGFIVGTQPNNSTYVHNDLHEHKKLCLHYQYIIKCKYTTNGRFIPALHYVPCWFQSNVYNKLISYFWITCAHRRLHCDDIVLCVISSVWGPHCIFLFAAFEETSGQSCCISISSSLHLLLCQLFPAARTDTPGASERKSSQISFYPSVITPQKAPETAMNCLFSLTWCAVTLVKR